MADDNPYAVVGSPNYAAPLLNFSPLSGQPQNNNQNQSNNQNQNGPTPQQTGANLRASMGNWAKSLQALLAPQQPAVAPSTMGPQAYAQPGAPLGPGSVGGANAMLQGVY